MASRKTGTSSSSTPDDARPASQEWVAPDEEPQQPGPRRAKKAAASAPAPPRVAPRTRKTTAPSPAGSAASRAGTGKTPAKSVPEAPAPGPRAVPGSAATPKAALPRATAPKATAPKAARRQATTPPASAGRVATPATEAKAKAAPPARPGARKAVAAAGATAVASAAAVPERPIANLPSFPSLVPERQGRGAVRPEGDEHGASSAPTASHGGSERSGLWLPLAIVLAVAALLIGILLIGSAIFTSVNTNSQLPGSPGFSAWPVVALVVVLAAAAWGLRAYANRAADADGERRRSKGWRWLFDTRVVGSLIAVLLVLAAVVLPSNTPGYSPDVRAIPGEVSGLLQLVVAQ
ncbi:MAG: hypothetical protein NVS3B24_05000 [Candidatus Dormibacteria bacterium]